MPHVNSSGGRKPGINVLAALIGVFAFTGIAAAQQPSSQIEIVPIRGHMYLVAGAGANIVMSIGPDGIFLVDSGRADMAPQVIEAINKFSRELSTGGRPELAAPPPKPIRYIADTTVSPDHVGGNEKLAEAGKTFTGGNVAADLNAGFTNDDAAILATENALQRLTDAKVPGNGLPSETYFGETMKLSHFFNDEGVELFHIPNANTDSDSIVQFRGSDVIAAGDIFNLESFPVIDIAKGGSIQGILAGLNKMIDMSVAYFRTEGGTYIIPGHGRICDLADLTYYRDMVTIIRDRIQDLIKSGKTLDQIKAADPTADWNPRYGHNPAWTPAMFVEAIYTGLTQGPKKAGSL